MGVACNYCDRTFGSERAAQQHMNALNHWGSGHSCRRCDDNFDFASDRDAHEVEDCNYCSGCDRAFSDEHSIRQHLNSGLHRGHNIACPFCGSGYATASGLCHHLERGACERAPALDRDEVYRIVRRKDPRGLISKNLIGWHGSPTYSADSRSWNGRGYECALCSSVFSSLAGLNQHLASPRHQQQLYHCPDRVNCGKEFKSLAAIMNHLESESCGYTRFDNVQRGIQNVISGNRLIGFGGY